MDLKEVEVIASLELAKQGLHGWTFGWGDTKRRLGVCKYRSKRIEIAEYYALHSARASVLDTLLHEIAHAIVGPGIGHGPAWKAAAIRLGATPKACDASTDVVIKPGDWQATCSACKRTVHLYRRPRALNGYRCRCKAGAPLNFEFMGDPARKPAIPMSIQESSRWEAKCVGCQTVHYKARKPKAGTWRCRCPQKCELTWRYCVPDGPQQ
jgi:hypothetical protein